MDYYKVATAAVLMLGLLHALYTFKKYKTIEEGALWFFSTSLALVFNGFLNYINLSVDNEMILNLTLTANVIQFIFCLVLSYIVRKPTTYLALVIALVVLLCSFIYG